MIKLFNRITKNNAIKNILCKILITIQKEQEYNVKYIGKYIVIIGAIITLIVCKKNFMLYDIQLLFYSIYCIKEIIISEPEDTSNTKLTIMLCGAISLAAIFLIILYNKLFTFFKYEPIIADNETAFTFFSLIIIIAANALFICNDLGKFIDNMNKNMPRISHHMAMQRAKALPKFCREYAINYYTSGVHH